MTFVDVHAHLDFRDFDSDREELVKEMKKGKIIALSNTLSPENFEYTKGLFEGFEDIVKVCPGLYPIDAQKISDDDFEAYLKLIRKEKKSILAIGEVGLDRHHSTEPLEWELQEKRFRSLIELGIKIDKPLIIHTRKAEERVLQILREYVEKTGFRKFVLHCFSGKKRLIKEIVELNILVSIPLTVLNTQSFQFLARELAVSKILVETDSPFLNPSKERNSPLNVPMAYREIAKIKGLDEKEIESIIYKNFQQLFLL